MVWDTFSFPSRFVVSMVTCAIVKGIVTPTMRETVRVGRTYVVIETKEESSFVLKSFNDEAKFAIGKIQFRYFVTEQVTDLPGQ